MATVENGLMLDQYADYMIASEETEPGIGWYYTNWLTALSGNTSMPTIEIGKNIVDDFISTCNRDCRGQSATLSVVDLAELSYTVPTPFKAFSESLTDMISNQQYTEISTARNVTREFARSSAIDQIDLVHFAQNVGNDEGKKLSDVLLSAVKYNRTSSNMTNSYGMSIYFPYRKTSKVDTALNTYDAIGMDASYAKCIREFASLEVSGQVSTGGTSSPFPSLLGDLGGVPVFIALAVQGAVVARFWCNHIDNIYATVPVLGLNRNILILAGISQSLDVTGTGSRIVVQARFHLAACDDIRPQKDRDLYVTRPQKDAARDVFHALLL